jgi:hypothetical protein
MLLDFEREAEKGAEDHVTGDALAVVLVEKAPRNCSISSHRTTTAVTQSLRVPNCKVAAALDSSLFLSLAQRSAPL